MRLIWHILIKDLRRLAIPLSMWAGLLVAKYALGWRMITWDGPDASHLQRMIAVSYLLVALEIAANFLLVTRLVHEDPLVSERAFWMTRPVAGRRLLAAKLAGVFLMFGVLPLVIEVPWWFINHYGWSEIRSAAGEALLWQILIATPALLLAVLTDGLSRLLLWTLVLAAFGGWWFALAAAGGPPAAGVSESVGSRLWWTRSCVELALCAVTVVAVVLLQFLTRRRRRTLLVVAAGVCAIGVVSQLWPWTWTSLTGVVTGPQPEKNSGISFTVARVTVPEFTVRTPDYVKPLLSIRYAAEGMPADCVMANGWVNHTWRWRDGTTIERESSIDGGWWDYFFLPQGAMRRLLGLPATETAMETRTASAQVTRSLAMRLRSDPPAYAAKIHFILARPERRLAASLQPGVRQWFGPSSVRVIGQQRRDNGFGVVTAESRPVFVDILRTLGRMYPTLRDTTAQQYWLVNRSEGTARGAWPNSPHGGITIGTVRIAQDVAWFEPAREKEIGLGKDRVSIDGAILVGIVHSDQRYFEQELKVERFEVEK